MTFCPNCGAAVEGRFCGKCGTAVTPAAGSAGTEQPSGAAGQYGATQQPPGQGYPPPAGQQYPPGGQQYPPPGQGYPPQASAGLQENVASALCYLVGLITGILFLVLAPYNQNRNIRFHAFQSIFLHVGWIVLIIVESVIASAMPFSLYFVASLLYLVVFIGGLVLWLYMMISAYQGKRVKLPIIGDLAEKQA
jgi:uncharacterized membrane protein